MVEIVAIRPGDPISPVGLMNAPFTPAASQEIQDAVAKAETSLKDGTIDPPATLK